MSIDNSLYVVVHTASDYIPYEQLQHEFVSTFVLGGVMTCLYIGKIESIRGPLNVFKKYGSNGEDVNKLFCTLPRSEWGQYFTSRTMFNVKIPQTLIDYYRKYPQIVLSSHL